jgi:hypothetical protein
LTLDALLGIKYFSSHAVDVPMVVSTSSPKLGPQTLTPYVAGQVANSQLFAFSGGAGPLTLTPQNQAGSCLVVKGNVLDITACNKADPNQSFTFGSNGAVAATATGNTSSTSTTLSASLGVAAVVCGAPTDTAPTASITNPTPTPTPTPAPAITSSTQATATGGTATVISVSRAGGVLNPSAAAEANQRDNNATRAFTSVSLKSASGQCLFIDATAGDFRENLIPIVLKPCDATSLGQKFDFITAGIHNNQPNSTLIVSSLTQGCLNFDPRRAAGDTVIIFSCGGRADGQGQVTNSQLFPFTNGEKSLRLQPEGGNGAVCLVPNAAGRLDQAACSADPGQVFTVV